MRTYAQLNETEQALARSKATDDLLKTILDEGLRFDVEKNHNDLQARIDNAILAADDNLTPWFAAEYVMDTCREDIEGMAQCDAEDAIYLEAGEHAVYLPKAVEA